MENYRVMITVILNCRSMSETHFIRQNTLYFKITFV